MVLEQQKPKCEEEEEGDEEEKQNGDRTTASTPNPRGEVKGVEDKSCLQNKEGRAKGSQAMTSHSLAERVRTYIHIFACTLRIRAYIKVDDIHLMERS